MENVIKFLELIITLVFSGIILAIVFYFLLFVCFIVFSMSTAQLDREHPENKNQP